MNYNKLIVKIKKNKYQNYLNLNKKFYLSYIKSRLIIIDKLENKKIFKSLKIEAKLKKKIFYTIDKLYFLFNKFKKTKKLDKKDLKMIYMLYKKFESNLILRASYTNNFTKVSKKETNLKSYVLLVFFIRKLKKINSTHKINSIIKINDHLIVNKFKPDNYQINKLFIKNIKNEINQILNLNHS